MTTANPDLASICNRQGSFAGVPVARRLKLPRGRLAYRWIRFAFRSARDGYWDFVVNGLRAAAKLPFLWLADMVTPSKVVCPICLWKGRKFYPNVGPGYDERDCLCPGCGGLPRQRDLLIVLVSSGMLANRDHKVRVVEVAPMRGFEKLLQGIASADYTSMDLERNAMIKGDITDMPFTDGEVNVFVCFHVLEHIPRVDLALREIRRVLSRNGVAVIQVPVDWNLAKTYEYGKPDPRDVGHVRRYGQDVRDRMAEHGFQITDAKSADHVSSEVATRLGLSDEPILFATPDKAVAAASTG